VDGARVLCRFTVTDEVVIEPHESAIDATFAVPPAHDALNLARSVVLIPQSGPHRNRAKIPSRARAISAATRIRLQVYPVDRSRKLTVDLSNNIGPVAAVSESVRGYVMAEVAEHYAECDR